MGMIQDMPSSQTRAVPYANISYLYTADPELGSSLTSHHVKQWLIVYFFLQIINHDISHFALPYQSPTPCHFMFSNFV
jgi:hypothetical protein